MAAEGGLAIDLGGRFMPPSTTPRSARAATLSRRAIAIVAGLALAMSPITLAQPKASNSTTTDTPPASSPSTTASGKSLAIPDALKAKGTVYHALPGNARQASFLSDAPFEKITGHSNSILGYAIAGPEADPANLQGGEWLLPVNSLRTGNSDRDQHLQKPEWLDAAKFPHIQFRLTSVQNITSLTGAKDPALRTSSATLVGEMTIKGITKPLTIPNATIRFRAKSTATANLADGDLLFISCKFPLTLSDFGIKHTQITGAKKVSNTIEIDTQLLLATVAPEEQKPRETPASKPQDKPADKPAANPASKPSGVPVVKPPAPKP